MANLGPQFIKNSYQDLVQITASNALAKGDGTSISNISVTASWAQSASNAVNAQTASFLSGAFLQGGNSFGATALLGTNDNQNLQLETSGSVRVHIGNDGNVGIGTTSPTAELHISGANADTLLRVGSPSAPSALFVPGSGNIGIGTTNPIVRLHLSQSSGVFQRVDINNANADGVNATQQYYTNTGAAPDFFGATSFRLQGGTTDAFKQFQVYIANQASPRFIINGSGNVGISTTNPLRRLHVDASGSSNTNVPLLLTSVDTNNRVGILFASSSLSAGRQHNLFHRTNTPTVDWVLDTSAGENATWNFLPIDDTNYTIQLRAPVNGGTARITTGLSQSLFSLGAGGTAAQHLNISSSGRVGVGTTTPRELFSVGSGNIALDAARYIDWGSGNSRITDLGLTSGQGYPITISTFGPIAAGASNTCTEKLRLTGSGSLGLGTTNPSARLHVSASSDTQLFRVTSGSSNVLNLTNNTAVFFAGTGTAPNTGFDIDIQGTGTANGGSVRINGNNTTWQFGSVSSVNRTGTIATDMFNVTLGGTSTTAIQNPMKIEFNANQNPTSGSGYTVLRLNATHATTAGTGSKLLQTWEFGGTQRSVVNITGSIGVGITTPSASVHISASLGLAPILAITPHHPLPTTNIPTGSFMVSASAPPRPFMWDGSSWYAL